MKIFSMLFLVSSIQGGFLVIILVINNLRRLNEDIFLALLLAIVSGYLAQEYITLAGYFEYFPNLMAVLVPPLFLLGPLYLFYVKFAINEEARLSKKDLLHLIPAFICFLTILPFYIKSGEEKLAMYHAPHPGFHLDPGRAIYFVMIWLLAFAYVMKSLSIINNKTRPTDGRMIGANRIRLSWLRTYTRTFLLFLFCFFAALIIFILTDFYQYEVMLSTILASSVLIHVAGYWAIRESRIIARKEGLSRNLQLNIEKTAELKAKILDMLQNEKLYQESELSAQDFCKVLNLNSQYFSQLINNEFKCSFTHLINSYRIEEAKKMIKGQNFNHLNLLGIALEVGFKTKNTFTRSFKKHTGMTPSEFRNSG